MHYRNQVTVGAIWLCTSRWVALDDQARGVSMACGTPYAIGMTKVPFEIQTGWVYRRREPKKGDPEQSIAALLREHLASNPIVPRCIAAFTFEPDRSASRHGRQDR